MMYYNETKEEHKIYYKHERLFPKPEITMWNRHLNKGVHVYISMRMWGRLRSNVCTAEATITMQAFFHPLYFKQACDDEGFPAETYWYLI